MTADPANPGHLLPGKLIAEAREQMAAKLRIPSVAIQLVREIGGGFSDAAVWLCDIARTASVHDPVVVNGQYILKGEQDTFGTQSKAHNVFRDALGTFGTEHVPALVVSEPAGGITADLYDIAGHSLDGLRSAEHLGYEDREEACLLASADLLRAQLSVATEVDYERTLADGIAAWLGPQFPNDRRGAKIRQEIEPTWLEPVFTYEAESLPNPLRMLTENGPLRQVSMPLLSGPCHGDLHLRNIVVSGAKLRRDLRYWIIDVQRLDPAPLLYDQAYLELSALLFGIRAARTRRIIAVLAAIDAEQPTVPVDLEFADSAVVQLIQRIRESTVEVLNEREPRRPDVWRRQLLLARIAAALNWAGKKKADEQQCRAAFVVAAWNTRILLRDIDPDLLARLRTEQPGVALGAGSGVLLDAEEALRCWAMFRHSNGGQDLYLISDVLPADADASGLADGRWTAVIDFDDTSDESGLSRSVVQRMRIDRHVSVFGAVVELTDAMGGTNWLMANGWASRGEPSAAGYERWRDTPGNRDRVRQVIDHAVSGTPNLGAAVLCLRSGRHSRAIEFAVEHIRERYAGEVQQIDLSCSPDSVGADATAFLAAILPVIDPAGDRGTPTLPGERGTVPVNRADLNRLNVDLEVLHSNVLAESLSAGPLADEFWRGRPPTWAELEAGLDVRRDAEAALTKELNERLASHQLTRVELLHSPGAGGTTLSRRVAWELHRTYPTAMLRRFTPTTIERIDELYQKCRQAVLLVAESPDLSESDREILIYGLQQRNSRAVVLWCDRTNEGPREGQTGRHTLLDPVSAQEKARFLSEYLQRAVSTMARDSLRRLAGGAPTPKSTLSPFYFGLCAYEDQFVGVESYVHNHLARLTSSQREVGRYLALVTRYSQVAMPIDLVRRWLGKRMPSTDDYGDRELRAVLGPDLRHLVVYESGTIRLLHPLIAEEVLRGDQETGVFGLGQVAVDFIQKLVNDLGPRNATTLRLLTELFVRRRATGVDQSQYSGQPRNEFSELVERIGTQEGVEQVFEVLTERCPQEPHFWNHRGRYYIYRVRHEYQRAEEFLRRAVDESRGEDPLHLHTLGMVYRFWIEDLLREHAKNDATAEEALYMVESLYDQAMAAFAKARANPNTNHSWVTPVQLIAHIVEQLMRQAGANNLSDLIAGRPEVARWVSQQIAEAERLLEELRSTQAAETRGHRNDDGSKRFYERLASRLDILAGDYNALIEQWRVLLKAGVDGAVLGPGLARALYARAKRDLSALPEGDLREIVGMVSGQVNSGKAGDSDLRLWFQAFRVLPEYSEMQAMERLAWYARERQSLAANYYLFVLHFLRWFRWEAQDQDRARYYLDECNRLSRNVRRELSFEWLGPDERSHPLVHHTELGARGPGQNFWPNAHLLRGVSGIIELISGPQAGQIRVDRRNATVIEKGSLTAFFAPRRDFAQSRDINRAVELYLGFSYVGLRAWVKPPSESRSSLGTGESDGDTGMVAQPVLDRQPTSTVTRDADLALAPDARIVPKPGPRQLPTADPTVGDHPDPYRRAVEEMLDRAHADGFELTSLDLGEGLIRRFGSASYQQFKSGPGKLRGAIQRLGFGTEPIRSGFIVDRK